MGKNVDHIQHIKSNVVLETGKPKLPQPSALVEGELAINYAEGVETISIKNSSGDVVTFSSDNYYTEQKLGSGFTGENSGVTVTDTILWESGTGLNSVVLKGSSGTASGDYSVAEGYQTSATSYQAHAEGYGTLASGSRSHAEGSGTTASGNFGAHAEGYGTNAIGYFGAHAEGSGTTASGYYSHAEGENSVASGSSSHAEGKNTTASGIYSHAEGSGTTTSGQSSHAEGQGTKANGNYSHAEGQNTTASGQSSHAEGNSTTASGQSSHAEGYVTSAMTNYSHAEGSYTTASGDSSHAEGYNTKASGSRSHAEGNNTIANNQSEHASGQYNVSSSASTTFGNSGNTLFSVGNGTANNARHNAFEIRQNGDIYISSGGTNILLQDNLGGTVDQVIDSSTSASTNAVSTKAVVDKLIEDEQVWAISLNELNNKKFGYANFDSTDNTLYFYKDEDDFTSGGTAIDSVDLSDISIDIDQTIDSGTSANTNAVSTSAVYGFVTSYTPSITVDQVLDNTTSASTNPVSSKAVYDAVTDNELVWTNAFVALSGITSAHTENTNIHVTAADKERWDSSSNSLWVSGTGENAIAQKGGGNTASGKLSVAEGQNTTASGYCSHAEGYYTTANTQSHAEGSHTEASGSSSHAEGNNTMARGQSSHAEGNGTIASGSSSHAEGQGTKASGYYSHAEGLSTKANNQSEHASGQYNVSSSSSTTFGDSGNTLFSVGNGRYESSTDTEIRHNAFEIRQNGDIYITSGGTTASPAIKLQDYIGNVEVVTESSGITAMTGYAMAASGTPISTSDTLNAAIGKLEKMIDELKDYIKQKELAIAAAITDLDNRLKAIEE